MQFLSSVTSNFLADIFAAIVIALFIKSLTSLFDHPKLSLVVKQGPLYSDEVVFTKRSDGDYEAIFHLAIKNSGNRTLMPSEGYWHLYFPNAAKLENIDGSENFSATHEQTHLRDLIRAPIFANSFFDFGPEYRLYLKKVSLEGNPSPEIYYFLQTSYGNFPKSASIDKEDGKVLFKNMARIKFRLLE